MAESDPTAREWRPGDKALIEVEVEIADPLAARVTIADDPGYWVATEALRPVGDVDEVTARDELVTAAKAEVERTFVEYGDEAGRGIHSWRCEYPDRYGPCDCVEEFAKDAAARLADVLLAGGVPGRSEAEIKAEGWDAAVRECHGLGWLHDFALSDALARNPYRAARLAGTTEAGDES